MHKLSPQRLSTRSLQVALLPQATDAYIQAEMAPSRDTMSKLNQELSVMSEVLKLPPNINQKVQMTDSEVQWASTPAAFDSVIQSEESLQVDVVAPVQAFKPEIPKDNRGIQAVILPTKFDVETQSGVISQIGMTQTAEQPKPAPQTEDQTVIHAQTITTATINKKLQVALLPQATDAYIQAEMAPSRYDVEAQSGIISHVGSTQTAPNINQKFK
ncbi:hypothetical protein FGIG_12385 [Fasciola gigantica]|uniref:Uncharacterized protein n=1 Tax=Fasciola gigantica TaxID=46835 RepID=A0A504YGR6_FASGI|nr:hypothetical protein FGIG_12385 [Fasciola gigantica]